MKLLFTLLTLTLSLLHANYPKSFSDLGTPLYKADKKFSALPTGKLYSPQVLQYHNQQAETLALANADKGTYFKALRSLTKEHDTIIALAKREMVNSIRNDDILSFQALNEAHIEAFYTQESFRKRIFTYYLNNKNRYTSTYLNKKIRAEKSYDKQYGVDITGPSSSSDELITSTRHTRSKKLILLSTTWCGQCKKAKAYLRKNGIRFIEYDAEKSSKGKSLMKKYHGTGYPTFIIGDDAMSGLSPSWIKERL